MTKDHAELIAKKENERRVDLSRMVSYPEYTIFKEELDKMVATLDRIDAIDLESKVSIEVQVMANKLARDKVVKFLTDMSMYNFKAGSSIDKTYI